MTKRYLISIGILGATSVILGAFGSHFLRNHISAGSMEIFKTGLQYQMYHTLALLALTFINRYVSRSYLNYIYYFFTIGIVLFSGSLYLLSTGELFGFDFGFLGPVTPFGGVLLILGWITLIVAGFNYEHKKRSHKRS